MKLLSEVPKDRLSQEEDEIIKGEVSEVAIRRALFHYFNEVIGHEDPEELTEDTIEDFITYIKEHT